MELTGVTKPDRVRVAGDAVLDIRASHAAQATRVVGVLRGAQTASELKPPRPHLVDSVADLPELIGIGQRTP